MRQEYRDNRGRRKKHITHPCFQSTNGPVQQWPVK